MVDYLNYCKSRGIVLMVLDLMFVKIKNLIFVHLHYGGIHEGKSILQATEP